MLSMSVKNIFNVLIRLKFNLFCILEVEHTKEHTKNKIQRASALLVLIKVQIGVLIRVQIEFVEGRFQT